jgi:V/A-type H+/Na+-transporting ATPase subunit E
VSTTDGSGPGSPEALRLAKMIGEQAAIEAAQSLAEARGRAEGIVAAARAEVEHVAAEARREGEARGRRRAAELVALTDAEARLLRLRAREALIDDAIERARTRLAELAGGPGAAALLQALVAEALAVLPPGRLRLRAAERDRPHLEAALRSLGAGERAELHLEPAASEGVIVESEDGRLRFDNRFEARLHRERESLRRLVAGLLFAGEDAT